MCNLSYKKEIEESEKRGFKETLKLSENIDIISVEEENSRTMISIKRNKKK